jgi:hypothetical protein
MTDRAQFEAMLEALINDDQESAKEIFHNIVVGKSREIYEELLAEDFSSQDTGTPSHYTQEGANPFAADSEEDDSEEDDSEEDDSEEDDVEADIDSAEDDAEEIEADAESDEESDGDIEDRVMDLEDALEDLKAEFEQLMAGEDAEEADHPGIHDMGGDDMGAMGGMDQGAEHDELAELMEYVLPVSGSSFEKGAVPGKTVGSGNYENAGENNTQSLINGRMKNDMGGTTANITNGGVEVHGDAGVKAGGTQGGLAAPTTKPQTGGNINVPGAKNATTLKPVKGGGIDRQAGFDKPGKNAGANTGANITPGEANTTSILKARK